MEDAEDWVSWYRTETGREPNYSELLDALASTQSERRDILHRYLEPQPGDDDARRPTKAHHAIARLVADGRVRVLVTTNFDRLLENALRDAGVEPTVIAHEDALAGAVPIVHARCTVIKVHGDYLDSRIKNTDQELATYSPAMDTLLTRSSIASAWSPLDGRASGTRPCVVRSGARPTAATRSTGRRGAIRLRLPPT
ncbi:SIR2 family protein [Caulobacter segnis]